MLTDAVFKGKCQVLPEEGDIEIFSSCNVRTSNLIVPEYPGNEYIIQVALV